MPKPFIIIIEALIACPAVIISRLSAPKFWLIISSIPISSISPITMPKWSIFLTVISYFLSGLTQRH
jgi:hypothetical protein